MDNVTPQLAVVYQVFVNGVAGENVISVMAIDANGNRSSPGSVTVTIPF